MPGRLSSHVYITGGDDIVDHILDMVQRAEDLVTQTVSEQYEQQAERMRQQATTDPQWSAMANDISWWPDEDGNAAFGVPFGHERYDQAVRTEYGDTTNAPIPLIRMGVLNGVSQMGWSMRQAFMERGF